MLASENGGEIEPLVLADWLSNSTTKTCDPFISYYDNCYNIVQVVILK
jgi:hypothetical protein